MNRKSFSKQPSRLNNLQKTLMVGGLILILAGALFTLERTNVTHFFHTETTSPVVTANQNTKGEPLPTPASPTPSVNSTSSQPGDTKSDSGGTDATASLITPTGNFVSAHTNIPVDAALTSVCNTTAAATCVITFSSGAVTKSLPIQTTDRGGSTFWNGWTPRNVGLTTGTWKVSAIATLNGQSKTAIDGMSMTVAQ